MRIPTSNSRLFQFVKLRIKVKLTTVEVVWGKPIIKKYHHATLTHMKWLLTSKTSTISMLMKGSETFSAHKLSNAGEIIGSIDVNASWPKIHGIRGG